MEIREVKPNFKPLTEEELKVKVSIDEYKCDEDKDEIFIRLKIEDSPFIIYREIFIPFRGNLYIDTGEDIDIGEEI